MKKKTIIGVVAVIIIVIIIAVLIVNSMSYKNKTITASNYDTIINEAKNSNLTDEEKAQLTSGLLRYVLNPSGVYGKKIKDVINEGKNIVGNIANNNNNTKNNSDTRTMEEFVQKFKDNGCEIDLEEKPVYSFIGANDGVIFYLNNSPVKIYKYSSEESYNSALNTYSEMKNWEKNGLFVLETNNATAKEIFKEIE